MKRILGVIALIAITISCSTDDSAFSSADCNSTICAPGNLFLQFFDSETGEDVFFNGTYSFSDIVISNVNTNETIEFDTGISAEFETAQIALNPFFESQDDVSLRVSVPQGFEINFSFDVIYSEEACCFSNEYTNVVFTGVESVDNSEGVTFYKVFL